jgi:MoxR-like ATPase
MEGSERMEVLKPVPAPTSAASSESRDAFARLRTHLGERIVGQPDLVEKLLVCLLADGHLLVEGAPGLAKTTAIKTLAAALEGAYHRIQFTPDLLPADLTGTEIFQPETGTFRFERGPLFQNLVLADEINRAPAKVQSALLEAMAERQITVGRHTFALPPLFLVMATQNPIEQEGTYPLPEAQLDRFLLHVRVGHPDAVSERRVLQLVREEAQGRRVDHFTPVAQQTVFAARQEVLAVHLAPQLEEYLVQLVVATRKPGPYGAKLERLVRYGASPRGTIALDRCSRAVAWLSGRDYVTPDDVHAVAPDVLRHRILLSYEAEAEGVTPDAVVAQLLAAVPVS